MAFGVSRQELVNWKRDVLKGEVAFLTHYWLDDRFPGCTTITKAACGNLDQLIQWGKKYGLKPEWIHHDASYPHFDLFGENQRKILQAENQWEQINRFNL